MASSLGCEECVPDRMSIGYPLDRQFDPSPYIAGGFPGAAGNTPA